MESPPLDAQSAFPPPTGLALASLVLGIAAVGLSFLVIGLVSGVIGIVLGMVYLGKKRGPTGMARWGVGLSIFGIVASLGFGGLYYYFFHQIGAMGAGVNGSATVFNVSMSNAAPLTVSSSPLKASLIWSATIPGAIPGAQALCAGDWASNDSPSVLAAAGTTLHVLDLAGVEKSTMPLPERFTSIACGRSANGPRLLGYTPWGRRVTVFDNSGKTLWSESAFMGLNGAHWGDVDGDGNDEMVMGMNGFGGLALYSGEGKKLWSVSLGNVWSQAIIPPATNRPAAVLATDASGSVNVFDNTGKRLNIVHSAGGYYTQMAAGITERNEAQILGFSGNTVEAFDLAGKAAWTTSALSLTPTANTCAVMGDFAGDGTKEWVFAGGSGKLMIVTTGGQEACSIATKSRFDGLAVAKQAGKGDLLLVLDGGAIQAYSFGR